MAHDHHHADATGYYLEQLATIAVSGALGGIAVMMWKQGMLNYILAVQFHRWVVMGGIALLVLAAVRAVTLWFTAGTPPAHDHDQHGHDHGHDHDHDHASCSDHDHQCGHDHDHHHAHAHDLEHVHASTAIAAEEPATGYDHGHDHGWSPWRYALLLLPIVLYFLNLPNQGFSSDAIERQMGANQLADSTIIRRDAKGDKILGLAFKELEEAAKTPAGRTYYEGRVGWIEGQLMPSKENEKVFTLVRFKITCCAADAVPLNIAIVSPESISHLKQLDWVRVEGQIDFRKRRDKADEYLTVLQLESRDNIKVLESPPANPYLQ